MTTVPGTYFTKEQLEVDLKVDNVSDDDCTGSERLRQIGNVYYNKKQYDKALAWYILAAMENNSTAPINIGVLYYNGYGVPQNYLCTLKWYLKAVEQCEYDYAPNHIGKLFENGYGVPLDKYKALEWFCHGWDKSHRDRLKSEGYHLSITDEKKSLDQLRKETEAIIDAEKKKLEEKQDKTQQEIEALVDLNITYKLTGGGQNAWKDVPILISGSFAGCFNEMKKQIQMLSQENSTFKDQDIELQSLKQEKQMMEQDKTNTTNEMERLKSSYAILEQLLEAKQDTIMSLKRENQMLSTANQGNQQGANEMVDTLKNLLQSKNNEIELLKQNMEHLLANKQQRNDAFEQENKILKQEMPQQQATVQNAGPSNVNPTNSDPSHHDQHDNSYNDLNYESEKNDTDDINYDTPSEDEDNNNDLNYDDVNESNK